MCRRSLYHDYFQLLPSASKPLEVVYQHSTCFAAQLLIAYTKLYPIFQANIHTALSLPPGGQSPINQPPVPLIRMITTWLNKRQDLCHTRAPHIPEALPLLHQRSSVTQIQSTPLPGELCHFPDTFLFNFRYRNNSMDNSSATSPRAQKRDTGHKWHRGTQFLFPDPREYAVSCPSAQI